jgi:hypothetical protein
MSSVVNKVRWVGKARMLAIILAVILAVAILVPMRTARASNVIRGASGPASVEFVSASADFINTMSATAPVNSVLFGTRESRIGTRTDMGTVSSGNPPGVNAILAGEPTTQRRLWVRPAEAVRAP